MTIDAWIAGHTRFQPDKPAIRFAGEELSYAQFNRAIEQTTILFTDVWQLRRGDRVAYLSLNHPELFVVLFAAAKLGLVVVPLNWRLAVNELAFIIDNCQPNVLLHDDTFSAAAVELANQYPSMPCIPLTESSQGNAFVAQREAHSHQLDERPRESQDRAHRAVAQDPVESLPYLLVYTSGTTGRPKGAVLSQSAVICNAAMSQHAYDLTAHDHVLNVLPLFHVGGINIQPLPALMYGGTVTLHATFDADAAVREIERSQITLINSVPTILQGMLSSPQWQNTDLTSLKAISIGSTDVPVELIHQVHSADIPLIQIYGATETGPIAIYQRIEHARSTVGSIGRCGLLCEVRLVATDGTEVPVGEHGEIWIKGGNVLSCYWDDDEATGENLVDGWFRTGDVARCDDDGNYWFSDRLKHVIISGGENIYAAEIERLLRVVRGVREVSVVGMPDPRWGEVPVAVVAVESDGPDEATLLRACDGVIARFKQPKAVVFVDALPRNALGKIQVVQVRQLVAQRVAKSDSE